MKYLVSCGFCGQERELERAPRDEIFCSRRCRQKGTRLALRSVAALERRRAQATGSDSSTSSEAPKPEPPPRTRWWKRLAFRARYHARRLWREHWTTPRAEARYQKIVRFFERAESRRREVLGARARRRRLVHVSSAEFDMRRVRTAVQIAKRKAAAGYERKHVRKRERWAERESVRGALSLVERIRGAWARREWVVDLLPRGLA